MNRLPKPEQDYTLLLEKTTASDKNPFGKTPIYQAKKPIVTKSHLRTITPGEATVIVREIGILLDAFSGMEYVEILRRIHCSIHSHKKIRKLFDEGDMCATLLLIESLSRIGQTIQLREKPESGEGRCRG